MRGLNNNKIWFIAIIDHKKKVYSKKNLWWGMHDLQSNVN
jgi:hypothetical protein